MTFFTAIASAIATEQGKRVFLEVTGTGEGRIRVIITPEVGEVPDDASAEVAQVYALMARPVVVTGLPQEVEAALSAKLGQVSLVQAEGESTLAALREIQQQAKANAAKAPAAKKPAAHVPDEDEDEEDQGEDDLELNPTAAAPAPAAAPASIGEAF